MKRLVLVLTILALILSVPLTAFAQDGSSPLCNGLSEADCAQLMAALGTLETVQSFTVPLWSAEISSDEMSLSASGRAGFVLGDSVNDIVLHLVLESLTMTPAQEGLPEYLEIIMAGGFGYVNVNGEWFGEELGEEDVADIEGQMDSLGLGSMEGLDELGLDLTGVLTTTRGEDADHMGQAVATYTMNFDLAALITAALASPLVGEAMNMSGGTEEEAAANAAMITQFAPVVIMMLGQTGLNAGLWVGNDDGYIHRVELNVNLDVNMAMLGADTPPIVGNINFFAEVSGVDEGYSVDVPSDYGTMEEFEEKYGGLLESVDVESLIGF
ncbi:MAG: hypothetical protein JXA10_08485 [Anaerolineae bacterium]|nr:hypothetical protein [Anaerolineae bacterium]